MSRRQRQRVEPEPLIALSSPSLGIFKEFAAKTIALHSVGSMRFNDSYSMGERIKQLLALGREHYHRHEYEHAERYLKQVLDGGTKYADVLNMLGVIYHDRGRFEEAAELFEKSLALNPYYTEAALNLAIAYNDLGRYQDARAIYSKAHPKDGPVDERIDPFAKGKIANLHAEIAQAYADVEMPKQAVYELRKAILLCPHFSDLRLKLANLYREMGDYESAAVELESAIRATPDFAAAQVALGVVRLTLGDREAAILHWSEVLRKDPDNKTATTYLRMVERMEE